MTKAINNQSHKQTDCLGFSR